MTTETVATERKRRNPYAKVNQAWPTPLPVLTAQEAVSAAKRLYRFGMGNAWKGPIKLTSGNRFTWIRSSVFYVNPDKGWHDLVHDISHLVHRRLHPGKSEHSLLHTDLEHRMVLKVVSEGWLDGKLRRSEKATLSVQEVRYKRILVRIKAWETKFKRAENALRKLHKQKTYYEKRLEGGGE